MLIHSPAPQPTRIIVEHLDLRTGGIRFFVLWIFFHTKNNPAVADINEKYKDKYIVSKPVMTTADIFPVIGKYESSVNMDAPSVTISLDPENKGMVWIEGLPQGKVKAMLRKSPATYKIPAQKTDDGKDVAEGTAIYDKETKTLNMVIGKNYNTLDPMAAFAPEPVIDETTTPNLNTKKVVVKKNKIKTKEVAKVKPWMYVGTKVETTVATN